MRIAFLLLVLLHGLIHVLGFVKGFGIKEVKELTLPISKPMGVAWMIATVLMLTYAVLYFVSYRYSWILGFMAVAVSQLLVFLFWKDARFGTVPNMVVLAVSLMAYGHYRFQELVQLETAAILKNNVALGERVMTQKDLTALPVPVQKWLQHSGAVGKPLIRVARVVQQAEMKMNPDQQEWMKATALQYSTIDTPAFIWTVDARMNSFLNFQGRDKFVEGKGEMLIKLNSLVRVVNERGEKLDEGTMQRYLGEMVWFPSLAISPHVSWQSVNDTTAIATMHYKGTKGSGTFYFTPEGDFKMFSALRFKENDPEAKRYEWVLLVEEYRMFEGIRVPSKMTATWKLEDRDWTWLALQIDDIRYNANALR